MILMMSSAHVPMLIMRLVIGTYYDNHTKSCFNCTAGSYTGSTGMDECEVCSKGQYSAENGASSCAYCESPLSSYEGSTECKVKP